MDVTGHTKESLVYTYINEREDKDIRADLQRIEYLNQTKDKAPEMKVIKKINKALLIITIILDFTILFGLYAQILLGFTQLCIALYISFNYKKLEKKLKYQVINYWIYVFIYFSFFIYLILKEKSIMDNYIILITTIIIIPMTIAIYFTITLNKIVNQNEK